MHTSPNELPDCDKDDHAPSETHSSRYHGRDKQAKQEKQTQTDLLQEDSVDIGLAFMMGIMAGLPIGTLVGYAVLLLRKYLL